MGIPIQAAGNLMTQTRRMGRVARRSSAPRHSGRRQQRLKKNDVRILQKRSGRWINLYPALQGQMPDIFTRTEAREKIRRMSETFGIEFKAVPAKEALKFEIPKRW
jgi:hypothetical protein